MKITDKQWFEAVDKLNAQDVPRACRIMRYEAENGDYVEAATDHLGRIVKYEVIVKHNNDLTSTHINEGKN